MAVRLGNAIGAQKNGDSRLTKHADYQRVYTASRKHFSASMSYFYRVRSEDEARGVRVGLTAGRVLGKAVERNRIKRRMREVVRKNLRLLPVDVDLVLHPRRSVLTLEFARLDREVARIFKTVQQAVSGPAAPAGSAPPAPSESTGSPHAS